MLIDSRTALYLNHLWLDVMFCVESEWMFTHRRSIVERGGCFQRRLFVCQFISLFVSLFVNMITSKRLNVWWWNLVVRYIVQKSRLSLNVKVKHQGCRGQKTKKCGILFVSCPLGCGPPPVLCSGKISTCCLVYLLFLCTVTSVWLCVRSSNGPCLLVKLVFAGHFLLLLSYSLKYS